MTHKIIKWTEENRFRLNELIMNGLLCRNCNTVLGRVYDDLTILQRAIDYLNKYKD